MRVVGLEADVVLAGLFYRLHAVHVVGEAAEDAALVIGRRRLGDRLVGVGPARVVLPRVVGPLEGVGDPTDLAFRVRQLQLGKAHEHA